MISGKTWGTTTSIFRDSHCEVHRIFAKRGGYCSKHKHRFKSNLFYVERGLLKVYARKQDYDLTDETLLHPGESTIIPPGEVHHFEALEDTVAFEVYFVTLEQGDIVREDHGGIK
jgi:quercetin dioxygenase-like cupin family protein